MGRLVIDKNSVYEIDEECVRRNHVPKECQIYQFLQEQEEQKDRRPEKRQNGKNR